MVMFYWLLLVNVNFFIYMILICWKYSYFKIVLYFVIIVLIRLYVGMFRLVLLSDRGNIDGMFVVVLLWKKFFRIK